MSADDLTDGSSMTGSSPAGGLGDVTAVAGAVFQVLAVDGQVAGAGFLVGKHTAFTCAHVVQAAGKHPGGQLDVVFPELPGKPRARALVLTEGWRAPETQDVAVLHLKDVPPQAHGLRVGAATGCRGHGVFSFGFPAQAPSGGHFGHATVAGLLAVGSSTGTGQLLQLREANDLTSGFSGAPVVDAVTDLVIGMITAIAPSDAHFRGLGIAYATSAEVLREARPQLAAHQACPYLGLEPFTAQHTEWFHGRGAAVEKVLAAFECNRRFLLLMGPSGAGKSSLVNAGLLPALAGGAVPGSDRWLPVHARPGRDLLAQLEAAGLPGAAGGSLPSALDTRLTADRDHDRILLVIDQFEELLTQTAEDARLKAVEELMALADSSVPVTVLLVMRNDFYAPLEEFAPDLVDAVFPGVCNIPAALDRHELSEIITRPAEAVGLLLESGLADRIVNDVLKAGPSARHAPAVWLPPLELALRQLWLRRRSDDGQLTHAAYEKIGGVTGSMTDWCNRALAQLPLAHRPVAQRILTSLVRPADQERGIPATRQLVPLNRLRVLAAASHATVDSEDTFNTVIAALTRYRIITTDTSPHTGVAPGEATAELIHDALLRDWADLRDWVAQDQRFRLWLERAAEQQSRYARSGLHGDLLDGTLLAEGSEWETRRPLPPEITAVLRVSRENQQASLRRTRRLNAILAGLLTLALLAGGIAFYQRHTATTAEQAANAAQHAAIVSQHQAQSRQLAALSTSLGDSDADLASLLAVKAWKTSPTAEAAAAVYAAPAAPLLRQFRSHIDGVKSLAFSPDGKILVTGGDDGAIRVWDVGTGKLRHTLRNGSMISAVDAVAFSPDGKILAAGGLLSHTTNLWNIQSDRPSITLKISTMSVDSMAFSPDGKILATSSIFEGGIALLWDVQTGKMRRALKGQTDDVISLAFSPDGKTLATGGSPTILWNTQTGKIRLTLDNSIEVAFSPDDKTLAASSGNIIRLWNVQTGKARDTLTDASGAIHSMVFSPDGRTLATGGGLDHIAHLWDVQSGEARITFKGATEAVDLVEFSPDGRTLATGGSLDGSVNLWNVQTGDTRMTLKAAIGKAVYSVAFSPDGRTLATGGGDGRAGLWDTRTGKPKITIKAKAETVASVAFSPDGKILATGGDDAIVRLWDAGTGAIRTTLKGHTNTVTSVAFSPDGKSLATASNDGTARVWDADTGKIRTILKGATDIDVAVKSVAFSPDSNTVATASSDSNAILWDAKTGAVRKTLKGHSAGVTAVAFSPDGEILATASSDGTAYLQAIKSGTIRSTVKNNTKDMTSAAFSPNGKILATSGGIDGSARLWDVQTAASRNTLRGHSQEVTSVAFSPDGGTLATASDDGTVRLWNIDSRDVSAISRSICIGLARNFTKAEKSQYLKGQNSDPVCPG